MSSTPTTPTDSLELSKSYTSKSEDMTVKTKMLEKVVANKYQGKTSTSEGKQAARKRKHSPSSSAKNSNCKESHDSLKHDSVASKAPSSADIEKSRKLKKLRTNSAGSARSRESRPTSLSSLAGRITGMVEDLDSDNKKPSTPILHDEQVFMKKHFHRVVATFLPEEAQMKMNSQLNGSRVPSRYSRQQGFLFMYNCGEWALIRYIILVLWMTGIVLYLMDRCTLVLWSTNVTITTTTTTATGSTQEPNYQPGSCKAKLVLIIFVALGVVCYLVIFSIYSTPKLVLRFYQMPWYLLETTIFAFHGIFLFFLTLGAYFFSEHYWATTFILLGTLASFLMAFVSYRRHTGNEILPVLLIMDPNMTYVQKLFSFHGR